MLFVLTATPEQRSTFLRAKQLLHGILVRC
jgi:hypothetical protein